MLELHRYKHVDWKPSPVVALAASVDGAVVAAARGSGAIEIWIVAPGSVGWHCELTFPGKQDASISSLLWCPSHSSKRGRLFSAGLDGFISEWDFSTLQAKEVLKSYGGSVWHMALEPMSVVGGGGASAASTLVNDGARDSDDDDDEITGNGNKQLDESGELKIAVACDDGCVRLFTVRDGDSLAYAHAFPRVQGRILSTAWSVDGRQIFSGGSDGCIRCWDAKLFREVYRITAGHGGAGTGSSLCIWSLLSLRDGTIVSGDSAGSTQFWDGRQGSLLHAHSTHKADVLALASAPSHRSVFSAGADGQVVQYQLVSESQILADAVLRSKVDVAIGRGDKWVFVGSKRTHSHDVNTLVVTSPAVPDEMAEVNDKQLKQARFRTKKSWMEHKHFKLEHSGISMLVSGGNDAKLYTYPANAFLAFHPHDVCYAPQRTPISLAFNLKLHDGIMMMSQHEAKLELWKISISQSSAIEQVTTSNGHSQSLLGKRRVQGHEKLDGKKPCNGRVVEGGTSSRSVLANGHSKVDSPPSKSMEHFGKMKGSPPELLARINCKSAEHITCSALSDNGRLVAFSDRRKPKLFEVEQILKNDAHDMRWEIRKKRLPNYLPPAHSMVFCGVSHLFLACPDNNIFVVDTVALDVLYKLKISTDSPPHTQASCSPIVMMRISSDGQWLATSSSIGEIVIFNITTVRQHWCVPPLDGGAVTAALFHPGNSDVLVIATAGNILHVLNMEERRLADWSRQNGSRLPRTFLEFPGGIQGLSMSHLRKASSVIAYGSKAMCVIDFKKPVPQDEEGLRTSSPKSESNTRTSNGTLGSKKPHSMQNGGSPSVASKNFILVPFKDPVLYLGHASNDSILVVEKPWLDALRQLPPPVYRHVYGT